MSAAVIAVRVKIGSGPDRLLGMRDGTLQARVSAAPVEGRANRALCRLIARHAGVAPSAVEIASGERSRAKLLRIHGIEQRDAERLFGEPRK
jgi:uncharacterized protein (TIGR00251 family)